MKAWPSGCSRLGKLAPGAWWCLGSTSGVVIGQTRRGTRVLLRCFAADDVGEITWHRKVRVNPQDEPQFYIPKRFRWMVPESAL